VLLRHAAVLGGRFAEPWLAEMLDRSLAETRHDLARLRHFLEPDAPGMVRFQHILLRDVAYEGLPYRTRRDLHRRAGIVLERSAGDDPDALSGLLSIHFHHARQFQKSWHYSVEAGRRSTAQGAPVEAAQFFDRALMAASHLTVDPAARTAVAEELGDALAAAGRYTLSVGAYRRARGVRRSDAVVGARVARKLGRALDRNGDYPGAIRWYRRAIEELGADQSADAQAQRAQTMVTWASSRFRLGQQRQALPALFAAIRDAEDCGALSTLAEAYRLVDQAYHELGEFEKAVFSERALAISTQLGDPRGVALANENLAALDLECGRWDAAIARYGLAGDFYKSVGQMVEFASCVANVGEVHRDQGRLREAEELFLEARSIWSGAGWKFAIGWVHSCLGQVTARAGRWHEADEYFRAAAQVLQELAAQQTLVMLNVRRLEALLLQGEFEASRSREQAVRRDAERLGLRAAITSLDRLIAHADAATGHVDAAIARVLAALEQSRARGTRYETAQCLEALARFHALAGSTEAEPIGQQAKEAYAALGVIWTPIIPLPGDAPSS
jgi:tetratricopeptide (TPR) repeat protein